MQSVQQKVSLNTAKFCKTNGCSKSRIGFSGHCSLHNKRTTLYGFDHGRRIWPKEYTAETERITALVDANVNHHDGIKYAISFFDDWMKRASSGYPGVAHKEMAEVHDRGITGRELLIECGALWLYSYTYPWILPDTGLDYALAIAVLTKAHNKAGAVSQKSITGTARRVVGQRIRNTIGVLLLNFVRSIREQDQKMEERKKAMDAPLDSYKKEQSCPGGPTMYTRNGS